MSANTSNTQPDAKGFRSFLLQWQQTLCAQLVDLEARLFPDSAPAGFQFDSWQRQQTPAHPITGEGGPVARSDSGTGTGNAAGTNSAAGTDSAAGTGNAAANSAAGSGKAVNDKTASDKAASAKTAGGLQGGGISAVLRGGRLWEQAGVNFSHVHGAALPPTASANRPQLAGRSFEAMGVSVVIHPLNPYVPTTHANVRLLVAFDAQNDPQRPPVWWFGGGFDLTPYYGFEADARHWHETAKAACAPFGSELYPKYKDWCDRYFYLPHREEPRGLGGLFFDDYSADGDFAKASHFARSVAEHLIHGYAPIVERRALTPYTDRERQWQLYRRGRYVEFNLVCDRGTHFGLQSKGRTESILMSLPPLVRWEYNHHPQPGSPEADLLSRYLPPQQWA